MGEIVGQGGVVSGEEPDAADMGCQLMEDGKGDCDTIEGARTPTQLVENDKRLWGGFGEDFAAVVHLNFERGCVLEDVVVCAHPSVDLVDGLKSETRVRRCSEELW